MSADQLDRLIKDSAMDTTGSGPRRAVAKTLRYGEEFERVRDAALASGLVDEGYVHVKVADYPSLYKQWDHSLINFYYENESDPRTTIIALRVGVDGKVSTP